MIGKVIAAIIGGFIVAILGNIVLGLIIGPDSAFIVFLLWWALSFALALTAKTTGKAWRRLMGLSAILAFALPLASFVFTGSEVMSSETGAEAVGTTIGGGLVALFAGFVGFFLGIIFLVIALFVGRDKQVVVVRESDMPPEG